MTTKEFSEAMGELDGRYVEEAVRYRRAVRPRWATIGAIAACLCLVICIAVVPYLAESAGNTDAGAGAGDVVPMVYVNDSLYQIAAQQPDLTGQENEFVYLGEIQSSVSESQNPTENFQANDDIAGAAVYQYGEDIVVLLDGQCWLYTLYGEGQGADAELGGTLPDGVDSVIASLAVYPATETIEDVADAAVDSLSEADAYGVDTLGEYLPTSLPDGYHFGTANLYETTMKDGTKYDMLRVQYATGSDTAQGGAEEELAADPNASGKSFVVFVMNYEPATEKQIYAAEDMTERLLEELDGDTFHLSYGAIYVGISPDTATSDDILAAVASIKGE